MLLRQWANRKENRCGIHRRTSYWHFWSRYDYYKFLTRQIAHALLIKASADGKLSIIPNSALLRLCQALHKRKNWLFVGNEECGQNLAIVMSLVTTCTKLGINPQEYLADILPRIQDHPANRVRDLLPDRWLAARQAVAPPKF